MQDLVSLCQSQWHHEIHAFDATPISKSSVKESFFAKISASSREDCLELLHTDEAIALNGKIGDIEAFVLQMPAAVKDAFVLCLAGNDVLLLSRPPEKPRNALDAHVIALRCSARKYNFLRICTNQVCNVLSCLLHCFVCLPTIRMCSRVRIAI